MNKFTVSFFATLKDRAGVRQVELELPAGARVRDLKTSLVECLPGLAPALGTTLVAVDREYAFDDDLLPAGAEIALFPPVSGG
jgi:molybdopterin synthase catalytic subunit